MKLRLGTRGSELALWQARHVAARLVASAPGLEVEEVVIKTDGDLSQERPFGGDWPVGAFVTALERALSDERVDLVVHSLKDMQTAVTAGLEVMAIPERADVRDVLVLRQAPRSVVLSDMLAGLTIATGSPRRAAQLRQLGAGRVVPLRGNVPTRLGKLATDPIDGVVLAAAGLDRLGLRPDHAVRLATMDMLPAAAQGALAVQARGEDERVRALVAPLDHAPTRAAVTAERQVLAALGAGCHTPVATLARPAGSGLELWARMFDPPGEQGVEIIRQGADPVALGSEVAELLREHLGELSG